MYIFSFFGFGSCLFGWRCAASWGYFNNWILFIHKCSNAFRDFLRVLYSKSYLWNIFTCDFHFLFLFSMICCFALCRYAIIPTERFDLFRYCAGALAPHSVIHRYVHTYVCISFNQLHLNKALRDHPRLVITMFFCRFLWRF